MTLALLSCGSSAPTLNQIPDPQVGEVVQKRLPSAAVDATPAPAAPPATGNAANIVLIWDGISPLHKSFFSDDAAVLQLGRDLAPHVAQRPNVTIAFDSARHIGRIRLRLLPATGVGLVSGDAEVVDLNRVSPILQGLARYRSAIAARYDTRVESFRISLEAYRGPTHCRIGAAGSRPPDGRLVDPCVQINGVAQCGVTVAGGVAFDETVADTIRSCLK
jgi:hypothetical protein